MDDWRQRAATLARQLRESGHVRDERWGAAFENIPRHVFVPRFFRNDLERGWVAVDHTDPEYATAVYEPDWLITQLDGDPDAWDKLHHDGIYYGGLPTSSSSSPELMALMLEALDVDDGHRFLEIGTGTGYNAAVISHRLGDQHLTSVDVDDVLVDQARSRLAELGHQPRLLAMDAMSAVPTGAYDRIEVTVAVPQVPAHWIARTRPGGLILVNLTAGLLSDAMFRLHVRPDGSAAGPAIHDAVFFMPTRAALMPPAHELHAQLDLDRSDTVTTAVDFTMTEDSDFSTFLSLRFRDLQRYLTDDAATWNWLIATDGSWLHHLGGNRIRFGGPRRLWLDVERLWRWWDEHGRPSRHRLGLSVAPDRAHQLWLDAADNPIDWALSR